MLLSVTLITPLWDVWERDGFGASGGFWPKKHHVLVVADEIFAEHVGSPA